MTKQCDWIDVKQQLPQEGQQVSIYTFDKWEVEDCTYTAGAFVNGSVYYEEDMVMYWADALTPIEEVEKWVRP